ncbi:hypothetical protein CEUSTIGMA_g10201.t1 [Chlamydomonas eustigma]|uniref:Protein dpy-30 homolog n=1 Tax=Chlamydomonas eustigma TaxID=1157962 RepID=A0A250XI56_9CHLO|nr:hypothetical protein CEUSTIGMA_g10201.t1 [Chlamydomonas eustigma]|eukprot:GAX82775.1 hypothetical protein CEUSTIGMA_g10201.t1 [Chlamydomonas eustigma]
MAEGTQIPLEFHSAIEAQESQPVIATAEAVKAAEAAALGVHTRLNIQAAPIRQYLEATVVPTVMKGLQAVCKERPENPIEYLAHYLLSHNPQGTKPPPVNELPPSAAAVTATAL